MVKSALVFAAACAHLWYAPVSGGATDVHFEYLTPVPGTPCMTACDDPTSTSCQKCCRTVTHEVDWGCNTLTPASTDTAACCTGDWDAACWNVASAANHDHACNQCDAGNDDDDDDDADGACGDQYIAASDTYALRNTTVDDDYNSCAPCAEGTATMSSRQGAADNDEDSCHLNVACECARGTPDVYFGMNADSMRFRRGESWYCLDVEGSGRQACTTCHPGSHMDSYTVTHTSAADHSESMYISECVECAPGYYMAEFDHTNSACTPKNEGVTQESCAEDGKILDDGGTTKDRACQKEVTFKDDPDIGGTVQASAAVANSTFALVALAFTALVSV